MKINFFHGNIIIRPFVQAATVASALALLPFLVGAQPPRQGQLPVTPSLPIPPGWTPSGNAGTSPIRAGAPRPVVQPAPTTQARPIIRSVPVQSNPANRSSSTIPTIPMATTIPANRATSANRATPVTPARVAPSSPIPGHPGVESAHDGEFRHDRIQQFWADRTADACGHSWWSDVHEPWRFGRRDQIAS